MFKIFVVFHKQIFDDCYASLTQETLDKHFVFIAVNKSIPKIYTPNKYNIINEWELPIISPLIDNNKLRENTAIYHVYANKLYTDCDYIGFAQYDTVFQSRFMENISCLSPTTCHAIWVETIPFFIKYTTEGDELVNEILKSYEMFFQTSINREYKGPLLNTYIIPVSLFNKLMPWVEHTHHTLIPYIKKFDSYNIEPLHAATLYERVMGIGIGAEKLTYIHLNVSHDHEYKAKAY